MPAQVPPPLDAAVCCYVAASPAAVFVTTGLVQLCAVMRCTGTFTGVIKGLMQATPLRAWF